jgi:hypothetical protein
MKKTNLTLALAGLMIASAAIVSSCKKKDATTTTPPAKDTDQSGASANNTAENTSNDIVSMGAQACDNNSGSLSTYRNGNSNQILGASCAVITIDSTVNHTITLTFSGGTCLDGKTRSGSLIYTYSNPNGSGTGYNRYRDPGFTLSVSTGPGGYVVNSNTVTIISKTIKNTTAVGFTPATTNATWEIKANISIALASGAGTINWTSDRIKTLLNTSTVYPANPLTTPINWPMAKIGITDAPGATTTGTRSTGETFSVTITNQLVRDFGGCDILGQRPFIQGTFVYAPAGKATRTFDYGSGTCDLNATVTIDGVTYPFTL